MENSGLQKVETVGFEVLLVQQRGLIAQIERFHRRAGKDPLIADVVDRQNRPAVGKKTVARIMAL